MVDTSGNNEVDNKEQLHVIQQKNKKKRKKKRATSRYSAKKEKSNFTFLYYRNKLNIKMFNYLAAN